jgi:hypothetical protein
MWVNIPRRFQLGPAKMPGPSAGIEERAMKLLGAKLRGMFAKFSEALFLAFVFAASATGRISRG